MKTLIIKSSQVALIGIVLLIASCSNPSKTDKAETKEEESVEAATGKEILINTETSVVRFTGYGVGKNHPGFFKIQDGKVMVENDKLTGGSFTISAKSLSVDQTETMFQTKLKTHLMSADFLDIEKYPSALFEITSVEPYTSEGTDTSVISGANYKVSGNLKLKDITKNVTFPAKIDINGNSFSALANFSIDRTLWGVNYGNDKSLKDNFISESVAIKLEINGK